MPQIKTIEAANKQHLEWPSIPGVIARLDLRLKQSGDVFGKISFTASVYIKQDSSAVLDGTLIDKIVMQTGYPDSSNYITFKNSGTLLNSDKQTLQPMIWVAGNSGSILKTVFASNSNNTVLVKYEIQLNLQKAKALGLSDSFSSAIEIKVSKDDTTSHLVTILIN
ncbi:hypothetical protein INP83_16715 [Mucilaginibacter sp. 21P]|uniref:hypothetical protein n=1 Tax=Mucilaginibacter sp. 21P TaxID=2778902 RepID=UPI001C56361E|nr:hypothetical protein [Mucilaginibacter sp. 21P]QXV64713.1 hypothetical protein INP83_16715 [Mucilaginibacter sp. 21P]